MVTYSIPVRKLSSATQQVSFLHVPVGCRPGVSEHTDCVLSIDDRDPVVAIAAEGDLLVTPSMCHCMRCKEPVFLCGDAEYGTPLFRMRCD